MHGCEMENKSGVVSHPTSWSIETLMNGEIPLGTLVQDNTAWYCKECTHRWYAYIPHNHTLYHFDHISSAWKAVKVMPVSNRKCDPSKIIGGKFVQ
jgi:hypothetical protein